MVKNPPANGGDTRHKLSMGLEDPLEKEMVTHPSNLAGKSHEQKSLESYNSWDHKRVRCDLVAKWTNQNWNK